MSQIQGMILGAVIIVFYTLMGGFLAVAWTDLIQGIIMIGTLVILPLVGWIELSGTGSNFNMDCSTLYGGKTGAVAMAAAIGGLSWGLGYMGQLHIVARYMAIDKIRPVLRHLFGRHWCRHIHYLFRETVPLVDAAHSRISEKHRCVAQSLASLSNADRIESRTESRLRKKSDRFC